MAGAQGRGTLWLAGSLGVADRSYSGQLGVHVPPAVAIARYNANIPLDFSVNNCIGVFQLINVLLG